MKVHHILLWLLAASSKVSGTASEESGIVDLDEPSDSSGSSSSSQADDDDSTPYLHFVAHNKTMTCTADEHATPFNNQIRGTNLGGWMVLEPWITPSLFYQVNCCYSS